MTFRFRLCSLLLLLYAAGACKWTLDTHSFPKCESPAGQINAQATLLSATFSLSSLTGTTDEVKWAFGDGQTASATVSTSVPHTYTAVGTYTVTATLTNKCGDSYVATKPVTVNNTVPPTVTLQDPTIVTSTGATVPMTITSNGNGVISRYGLWYSSTNNSPSANDSTVFINASAVVNTVNSLSISGLKANTLYYVRAFAVNNAGTGSSADVKTLTTKSQPPAVTTGPVSSVDKSTATVQFRLDNAGNPPAVRYGICYSSATATPEIGATAVSTIDLTNATVGIFIPVSVTGLTPNTTYNYRAYAQYTESSATKTVYGATTLSFKTLTDIDLTTGLILDMPFNGNASDFSGNGNNGTLLNGATFTTNRKGATNSALLLDGLDDYVDIPDDASLRPASISISLWIKPGSKAGQSRMQIFVKNRFADGENEQYSAIVKEIPVGSSATKPYTNFDIKQQSNCQQSQGWQDLELSDLVLVDTWQHFVFVYSGTTLKEYQNGALVRTKTGLPQAFMDNCAGGSLKFGAQSQSYPNYFQGAMDDVRIYNLALTDAQVSALYNQ